MVTSYHDAWAIETYTTQNLFRFVYPFLTTYAVIKSTEPRLLNQPNPIPPIFSKAYHFKQLTIENITKTSNSLHTGTPDPILYYRLVSMYQLINLSVVSQYTTASFYRYHSHSTTNISILNGNALRKSRAIEVVLSVPL